MLDWSSLRTTLRDRPPLRQWLAESDVVVPLLLAVFVIVVSAFVATVALDMGQDTDTRTTAGATVDFDADSNAVRVVFTSMSRPGTTLDVTVEDVTTGDSVGTVTLQRVGQSHVFGDLTDTHRYRVVVVAVRGEEQFLVAAETGEL